MGWFPMYFIIHTVYRNNRPEKISDGLRNILQDVTDYFDNSRSHDCMIVRSLKVAKKLLGLLVVSLAASLAVPWDQTLAAGERNGDDRPDARVRVIAESDSK